MTSAGCTVCWLGVWISAPHIMWSWRQHLVSRTGTCMVLNWKGTHEKHLSVNSPHSTQSRISLRFRPLLFCSNLEQMIRMCRRNAPKNFLTRQKDQKKCDGMSRDMD